MASEVQSKLRQLHAALEAAGDLAYVWELASDKLDWHGAIMARLGGSHAAALVTGRSFAERIHPEDRSLRENRLEASASPGDFFQCEYRLRDDEGATIWVQERGRAELDANGAPKRLMSVLRLITDRKVEEPRLEPRPGYDERTSNFNRAGVPESMSH